MPSVKPVLKPNHFGPHFEELHKKSPEAHTVLLDKHGMALSPENIARFYAEHRPKTFNFYVRKLVEARDLNALTNLILLFRSEEKEKKKVALDIFKIAATQDRGVARELIEIINAINSKKYPPTLKKASETKKPTAAAPRPPETPKRAEEPKKNGQRKGQISAILDDLVAKYGKFDPKDKKNFINLVAELEEKLGARFDIEKLFKRGLVEGLMLTLRQFPEFLMPRQTVELRGVTYAICNIAKPQGQHRNYVAIVSKKNGELNITLNYKSGSSDTWRLLPLILTPEGSEYYYKSERKEEKLALPWEVQKALDSSPINNVRSGLLSSIHTVAPYLEQFRLSDESTTAKARAMAKMNDTIFVGADENIDVGNSENRPSLSPPQVLDSWHSHSEVYGKSKKVVLISRNKKYVWTFDVTKEGAFISSIELADGEVSKYGLARVPTIIDPSGLKYLLITPPREYSGQLLNRLYREQNKYKGTPLGDKLLGLWKRYLDLGIDNQKEVWNYVNVFPILVEHPLLRELNIKLGPLLTK
jgi:hypothetical protein